MTYILDEMSLQQFLMYKEHMECMEAGEYKIYEDEGVRRIT